MIVCPHYFAKGRVRPAYEICLGHFVLVIDLDGNGLVGLEYIGHRYFLLPLWVVSIGERFGLANILHVAMETLLHAQLKEWIIFGEGILLPELAGRKVELDLALRPDLRHHI